MTKERLEQIFETMDSKWEGDNALQGLYILSKYATEVLCAAEHDIIYSVDADEIVDKITEDDAIALAKLNWMIDSEFDCFACFV